ncbi:MAG: SDR family oxidoreductase [Ardenticatenaceae bacterium]|nr:SDR family oxidoreductase [Ardenticatenaceae bacterium]
MPLELQATERVVLVTGATGSLGRAVSHTFASEGAYLVLNARHQAALDALAAELEIRDERLLVLGADVTDPESVYHLIQAAEQRFGHVDVLAHIAGGFATNNAVAELDVEQWHQMLHLNLESAVYMARAVLPGMIARGYGKLVFVGSRAAERPFPGSLGYAVSKAGLEVLVKTLAAENKRKGINTNMVTLTMLDTEANRQANPEGNFEEWVDPVDVAAVIRFLAGDGAKAIHGAIVPVWGVL